jgi:uncharacterized protein DUF4838
MKMIIPNDTNKIILVNPKTDTEKFAAKELQKYIEAVTEEKIPVYTETQHKFHNGSFILAIEKNLETDEFSIKSDPEKKRIEITGTNPRSLLYAVYSFLRKTLGVEWTSPTKTGEYISKENRVEIERFHVKEQAMLKYRGFYIDSLQHSINAENISYFIDWMAKNYGNFLLVSVMFYEKIKKPLLKALKLRSMILEVGHHGFNFYVEPKTHFQKHPDWFSEVNGKRVPGSYFADIIFSSQLCTSNKEVINYYAKSFMKFWEKNPDIDILGIIPNDGFGWCECCECKKLEEKQQACSLLKGKTASGRYHHFVNEIIKKKGILSPDKKVSFWAYADMIFPSSKVLELPSNTLLSIALYDRWYNNPLNFNDKKNSGTPNQIYVKILREWRETFTGEINIYEYYEKYIWQSMPKWMPGIIRQDTKFFKDENIQGLLSMLEEGFFTLYEPNYMAQLAMSWSSKWTSESFLDEYTGKSFGGMSKEVKKEINKVISAMKPFAKLGPQYPRELSPAAEKSFKELEVSFNALAQKGLGAKKIPKKSASKLTGWSKNMKLTHEHFALNSLSYDLNEAIEEKNFGKAIEILDKWEAAKKKFYKTFKDLDGTGVCLSDDAWVIGANFKSLLENEEKLRTLLIGDGAEKEINKLINALKRLTC